MNTPSKGLSTLALHAGQQPDPNLVAGMKWLLEQANARPGPGHFRELAQELFAL